MERQRTNGQRTNTTGTPAATGTGTTKYNSTPNRSGRSQTPKRDTTRLITSPGYTPKQAARSRSPHSHSHSAARTPRSHSPHTSQTQQTQYGGTSTYGSGVYASNNASPRFGSMSPSHTHGTSSMTLESLQALLLTPPPGSASAAQAITPQIRASLEQLSIGQACTLYARSDSPMVRASRALNDTMPGPEAQVTVVAMPVHVFLHAPAMQGGIEAHADAFMSPRRKQPVGSPHSPYYSHHTPQPNRFFAGSPSTAAQLPATLETHMTLLTHADIVLQHSSFIVMPAALYSDRQRNLKHSTRQEKIQREQRWIDEFLIDYPMAKMSVQEMKDLWIGKANFQKFLLGPQPASPSTSAVLSTSASSISGQPTSVNLDVLHSIQTDACYTLVGHTPAPAAAAAQPNGHTDSSSASSEPAAYFCLEAFTPAHRATFTAALIEMMQYYTHQAVIKHSAEEIHSRRQSAIHALKRMHEEDSGVNGTTTAPATNGPSSEPQGIDDRYSFATASLTYASMPSGSPNSAHSTLLLASPAALPGAGGFSPTHPRVASGEVVDLTPVLAETCDQSNPLIRPALSVVSKGNSFVWHRMRQDVIQSNPTPSVHAGLVQSSAVYVFLHLPLLNPSTGQIYSFQHDFSQILSQAKLVWMDIQDYAEMMNQCKRVIYQHKVSKSSTTTVAPVDESLNQPSFEQVHMESEFLSNFLSTHPEHGLSLQDLCDLYLGKSGPSRLRNEPGCDACVWTFLTEGSEEVKRAVHMQMKFVKRDTCFTLVGETPSAQSPYTCLSLQSSSLLLRSQFTDSLLEVMKFLTQLEIKKAKENARPKTPPPVLEQTPAAAVVAPSIIPEAPVAPSLRALAELEAQLAPQPSDAVSVVSSVAPSEANSRRSSIVSDENDDVPLFLAESTPAAPQLSAKRKESIFFLAEAQATALPEDEGPNDADWLSEIASEDEPEEVESAEPSDDEESEARLLAEKAAAALNATPDEYKSVETEPSVPMDDAPQAIPLTDESSIPIQLSPEELAAEAEAQRKKQAEELQAKRRQSILESALQAAQQAAIELPPAVDEESEEEEDDAASDDDDDAPSTAITDPLAALPGSDEDDSEAFLPVSNVVPLSTEDAYQAQQKSLMEQEDPLEKQKAQERAREQAEKAKRMRERRASKSEAQWTAYLDEDTGKYYWHNSFTNETTWEDPRETTRLKLEAELRRARTRRASKSTIEWEAYLDEATGKIYWVHPTTGQTQWEDPRPEAVAERAAKEQARLAAEEARLQAERAKQAEKLREEEAYRLEQYEREQAIERRKYEEQQRQAQIEANKIAIREDEERRVRDKEEARLTEIQARKQAFADAKARAEAEAAAIQAEKDRIAQVKQAQAERSAKGEEERRATRAAKEREDCASGSLDDGLDPDDTTPIDMQYWIQYFDSKGREYWHNSHTKQTIWNHPERQREKDREKRRAAQKKAQEEQEQAERDAAEAKAKQARFHAAQSALGAQFGAEPAATATKKPPPSSGATSSLSSVDLDEIIDMDQWQSFQDEKDRTYWYNMTTGETIWMHPIKRQEKARKRKEMEIQLAEAKRLAEQEAEQVAQRKKAAAEAEAKRLERERVEKERLAAEKAEKDRLDAERRASGETVAASSDESQAQQEEEKQQATSRFLLAQQALSSQFGAQVVIAPASKFSTPPLTQRGEHKRRESKSTESWTAYTDPITGRIYWYNAATGESSWTDPNVIAPQDDSAWTTHQNETGKTYWFNSTTGETTWLNPHLVGEERAREEQRLLAEAAEEERVEREELEASARAEAEEAAQAQREQEEAARKVAEAHAAAEEAKRQQAAAAEAEVARQAAEAEARRKAESDAAEARRRAEEEAAEALAAEQAEAEEARALEEAQRKEQEQQEAARLKKQKDEEDQKEATRRQSQSDASWTAYTDDKGRTYWYNSLTKVSSWNDPRQQTQPAPAVAPTVPTLNLDTSAKSASDNGPLSPQSPMSPGGGPSFTEEEIEAAWKSYVDKSGKQYWYNSLTKVSCWSDPRKDRTKLSPGNIHVSRRASYWARNQKQNLMAVLEAEEEHEIHPEELDETHKKQEALAAKRKLNLSAINENEEEEEDEEPAAAEKEADDSSTRRPSKASGGKKTSRKGSRSGSSDGSDDSSSSEEDESEEMYQARAAMVPEASIEITNLDSAIDYISSGGNFILYTPNMKDIQEDAKEEAIQMWIEIPPVQKSLKKNVSEKQQQLDALRQAKIYYRPVSGQRVASPAISKDKLDSRTVCIPLSSLQSLHTGLPEDFAVAAEGDLTPLPMTSQQCLTLNCADENDKELGKRLFLRSYRLTRDRKHTEEDEKAYGYDKRTLDECEKQRENWMQAMNECMKVLPKEEEPTSSSSSSAASSSSISTLSNPLKPIRPARPPENLGLFDVAMRLMRRGALFTRFLPEKKYESIYMWLHVPGVPEVQANAGPNARQSVLAAGSPAQIIHFTDLQYASLQWVPASDSVSKNVDPRRGLPLSLIQDAVPGKSQTISPLMKAVWSVPSFGAVDESTCLNYLAPASGDGTALVNILSLQASSHKVRDAWINAWGAYWAQEQFHREQLFNDGSSVRPRSNSVHLQWEETAYGAGKDKPAHMFRKSNLHVDVPSSGNESTITTEPVEEWIEYMDGVKKRPYYYNPKTQKTVWKDPRKTQRNSIVLSHVTKKPIPALPPTSPEPASPSIGASSPEGPPASPSPTATFPAMPKKLPRKAGPPIPAKKKASDGASPTSQAAVAAARLSVAGFMHFDSPMSPGRASLIGSGAALASPTAPIASKKSFLDESLEMLHAGAVFTRYALAANRSFGQEISESQIFLWLDAVTRGKDAPFPDQGTPSGAVLCWNVVPLGTQLEGASADVKAKLKQVDVNTSRLRVENISELLLSKQSRLFGHPSLQHISGEKCFSFLSSLAAGAQTTDDHPLDLNVSAASESVRDAWFTGVIEVIQEYVGWLPRVRKDVDGEIEAVSEFSSAAHMTPLVPTTGKYVPLPLTETLSLFEYGSVFRSYAFSIDEEGNPTRTVVTKDIFLFGDFPLEGDENGISADGGHARSRSSSDTAYAIPVSDQAGARLSKEAGIYFCDAGSREKDPERRFLLSDISDLYVGKKTAELRSITASMIPAKFCFTLYSKRRGLALHLQTDSEYTREAWLKGMVQVLQSYSKRKMIAKRESVSLAPAIVGGTEQNGVTSSSTTPAAASTNASTPTRSNSIKLPPPLPSSVPSQLARARSATSL